MKYGVFWVICKGKDELERGEYEILPVFDTFDRHSIVWEQDVKPKRKDLVKIEYDYFPRGRIWLDNDVAKIFVNHVIELTKIIEEIKALFELNGESVVASDAYTPPPFSDDVIDRNKKRMNK